MNLTKEALEILRFPIGRFQRPDAYTAAYIQQCIHHIESMPTLLRQATNGLSDEQLDTPYRPEGWTLRQVVHHLADSHMNAYIRFKLALTEDNPTIKPYDEKIWATLNDGKIEPIDTSLDLLDALHFRWTKVLNAITPAQWKRTFFHPESKEQLTLDLNVGIYAWHSQHHVGHIEKTKERLW